MGDDIFQGAKDCHSGNTRSKVSGSREAVEVLGTVNFKLREAGRECGIPYRVDLVSTGNDLRITSTMSGLQLIATAPWSRVSGNIDTLLVVGGVNIWTAESSPSLLRWLRNQSKTVRRLGSVCVRSCSSGPSGCSKGNHALVFYSETRGGLSAGNSIPIHRDRSGCHIGDRFCLSLVKEDLGLDIALRVARALVLFVRRSGGENQFSTALAFQGWSKIPLRELPIWIVENLGKTLSIDNLVSTPGMSVRNFSRTFAREFGSTPARIVARLRFETAKRLLQDSEQGLKQIAAACGLGSVDAMQRVFRQQTNGSVAVFRRKSEARHIA